METDDHGHGLIPRHAEGLGLVLLEVEIGVHRERLLGDGDCMDPVDGQRHEEVMHRHLAHAVQKALDGEEAIGIVAEIVGPVSVGRLILQETAAAGDDGFHQLEDDRLEVRVVLRPPCPASDDSAERQTEEPLLTGGEALQLEEGNVEAGSEGLLGAGLRGGPDESREFLLGEEDRRDGGPGFRGKARVAQPAVAIPDDGITDGLEGSQIPVDGLASGVEARSQLIDRGPPALFQDPQEGEEPHHLPVAPSRGGGGHGRTVRPTP